MFSRTQNPTQQQQQQSQQADVAPKSQHTNPLPSMIRRFSRGSQRKNQVSPQSPTSYAHNPNIISGTGGGVGAAVSSPTAAAGGPGNLREQSLGGQYMGTSNGGGGVGIDGRPISSATDASYDFANRPLSMGATGAGTGNGASSHIPQQALPGVGLSRTDQIVLKHFWQAKHQENMRRDLHYLKFPPFGTNPGHRDLLPYCEIYHLVKTSPGANIISLGSANGVYIGFELQTGSQLHIDLDDDWFQPPTSHSSTGITHHRISFRPLQSILSDPASTATFKSWPKPLTIEFLEDQYLNWTKDLMSPCWQTTEVRELTGNGDSGGAQYAQQQPGTGAGVGSGNGRPVGGNTAGVGTGRTGVGAGSVEGQHDQLDHDHEGHHDLTHHDDEVDDDYVSEKSDGGRI